MINNMNVYSLNLNNWEIGCVHFLIQQAYALGWAWPSAKLPVYHANDQSSIPTGDEKTCTTLTVCEDSK